MKKKLSYLIVCLITMITLINSSIVAFADETYDNVDLMANYGVVIDYETGKVLGGKNIDSKVYPASTTKIWTAYLVVKNVKNLDEPVEITEPPGVDGSSMYLEVGEIFTVRELLQGLLIHSSNDAAVVLAKYVSGSTQDFAQLMNKEAKKAGALNTHFNNPHGLPDDNHYTTPYDMAMLARKAMSEKVIREIVSTKSISFKQQNTATSKINTSRYFTNTNLFLTSNDKITYRKQSIPIKYDIVEKCVARKNNFEIVNVVPQKNAGGGVATSAYELFKNPVVVEKIVAKAGLDIGDTSIGMHVKFVQVPARLSVKKIGDAHISALTSRSKLIGGSRAVYQ